MLPVILLSSAHATFVECELSAYLPGLNALPMTGGDANTACRKLISQLPSHGAALLARRYRQPGPRIR